MKITETVKHLSIYARSKFALTFILNVVIIGTSEKCTSSKIVKGMGFGNLQEI